MQSRMYNPETLGTPDTGQFVGSKTNTIEETDGAMKNGQSRDTGNIGYTSYRTVSR